jgi:hypothetical protein
MPHLLVKPSPFYFFSKTILFIGTHSLLVICRGNIGEPTCGEFFSSTRFESTFTKEPTIFSSSRTFNFIRNSNVPYSSRGSSFIRDESILTSARNFKPTKDSTSFSSVRIFSFTEDPSSSPSADHPGTSS